MTTIPAEQDSVGPTANPERWALAGLCLSMLLAALGTSIANVALPTLAQTFAAPVASVQWVVIAYLLAITAAVVVAGRLGDLIGRRLLLLAGIGLFALASALCALAPTLGLLIAARALQGLGAAIMMALTMACVGETVAKARIGSAMGLLGTMSAVGTALGPTLGGVLIAAFGWPAIFVVMVPLGMLTLLLVQRGLPAVQPAAPAGRIGFDHAGTALLALTLVAYALAMTMGGGGFGPLNAVLLVAAVCGVGLFLRIEATAAAPLIRLAMFRNPVLGAGFAIGALITAVVMATLVVGPFHLAGALALDAVQVGLVMSTGPIVAALAGVPAGRLVDRHGAPVVIGSGLIAMAAGSAALALLPPRCGVPGYIIPLVVITAGYALVQAANNTAVMTGVPTDQRGVASGLLNLSRNLGLITGASLMGAVFAVGTATSDGLTAPPEAVAAGMRLAFAVAAGLVVAAGMIWAWQRRSATA